MTTEVPENVLDEVGRELAGLEQPTEEFNVLVRRFIGLHQQKQEAEAVARKLGQEKDKLEELLTEQFGTLGYQNVKLDGFCVSRKKETYCSLVPETKQQALDLLAAMGYADMLTVNHNTLRSRVKEWVEQENMPPEFEPLVKLTEGYGLAVRKG